MGRLQGTFEPGAEVTLEVLRERGLVRRPGDGLRILGEGNLERQLRDLARALAVEDTVDFKGHIDHARLPDVYASSDLFVLPSLNEGMSNTVLEAMACGLPIVTTGTGGSNELIKGNGTVILNHEPKTIADAVCKLLGDPGMRETAGTKSRELATGLSWSTTTERYLEIYRSLRKHYEYDTC